MVKLPGVIQAVEKATQGMLQKETEEPKGRTMRNSMKKGVVQPVQQESKAPVSTTPASATCKDAQVVISKLPTAKHGKKFLGKLSNMGNRPLTLTEKKSLLSQSEDPEKGSDIKMEQVIEDCQTQIDDTSYGDFLLNQGADDDNKPIIIEPQSDSVHKITDTEKPRTGKVR